MHFSFLCLLLWNSIGSPFVVNLSDKEGSCSLSSYVPTPETSMSKRRTASNHNKKSNEAGPASSVGGNLDKINTRSFQSNTLSSTSNSHHQQVIFEEGVRMQQSTHESSQHHQHRYSSNNSTASSSYHLETRKQTWLTCSMPDLFSQH